MHMCLRKIDPPDIKRKIISLLKEIVQMDIKSRNKANMFTKNFYFRFVLPAIVI